MFDVYVIQLSCHSISSNHTDLHIVTDQTTLLRDVSCNKQDMFIYL